jgi:hypothetical protein
MHSIVQFLESALKELESLDPKGLPELVELLQEVIDDWTEKLSTVKPDPPSVPSPASVKDPTAPTVPAATAK